MSSCSSNMFWEANPLCMLFFFFFNDTATTEIYTLSLHDALPISIDRTVGQYHVVIAGDGASISNRLESWGLLRDGRWADRKSTRLNSSHGYISYAVFCLKKKNNSDSRCMRHA